MKNRDIERFRSSYKRVPGCCWTWNKSKNGDGYGIFYLNGHNLRAHRFAWMLYEGPIPKGKLVCHTCDNPSCVNHAHLFLGTNQENMQDCVKKGRNYDNLSINRAKHNPKRLANLPKGETHHKAKLNVKQVLEMRKRYKNGERICSIAKDYPTNESNIQAVCKGLKWKKA